jgi:catechol 2,3-dioxygenase-like lactoylglutathione lyase family enzyme
MTNNFINTIVFVKDINESKRFYVDVLNLKIINDFNTIVFFENHFVLHSADSIMKTVFKHKNIFSRTRQGRKNILIYFENADLDGCYNKILSMKVILIHGIEKQAWGQNVFRFYDPDGHIIEVGEPLPAGTAE